MKIEMPSGARVIIEKLRKNGYDSYIVGGCVRDALLLKKADDFDITTSALPETVKSLFTKTVDTGIKHGTVTVVLDDGSYEVTTYRIDGEYTDNRHPTSVIFTGRLDDDLSRRDFTVNAMAYNDESGVVDPFGGRDDLENKIIRAVGDPYKRFAEDALRILRAIRFSAVLGFSLDEETQKAAVALAENLRDVSGERIAVEWKKLLSGENAYEVLIEHKAIIRVFLPEVDSLRLPEREAFMRLSLDERQLLIFALTDGSEGFLKLSAALKFDNKTKNRGLCVLNSLDPSLDGEEGDLGRFLIGKNDIDALSAARICDLIGKTSCFEDRIRAFIKQGTPRSVKELDFCGNDAESYGFKGKECGALLNEILLLCASQKLENSNEKIREYVEKRIIK